MNKYLIITGSPETDQNRASEKTYFSECTEKEIPYITITSKKKMADIHWDYITINPKNDNALFNNEKLSAYLFGVFQTVAGEKSEYKLSPNLGDFYNIPIDLSERAAEAIYVGLSNEIKSYESSSKQENA